MPCERHEKIGVPYGRIAKSYGHENALFVYGIPEITID